MKPTHRAHALILHQSLTVDFLTKLKSVIPRTNFTARRSLFHSILVSVVLWFYTGTTMLQADTFDLSASQVGGFFADGSIDNSPAFQNYYVGYSTLTSEDERRNFFYFDLSGVTTSIVGAELSLTLPFGGLIVGAGDEIEEFVLSGTSFLAPELLDPDIGGDDAIAAWTSFGDPLELIGAVAFDTADPPIVPVEGLEIVIPLNPLGIDLINANLGGDLMLTGRMLDVTPLDPDGEKSELIFGLSDISPPAPFGFDMPFLSLTTIPEPSASLLLVLTGLLVAFRRNRQ